MRPNRTGFEVSLDLPQQGGGSRCFDDDDHLKKTGTMWTVSARMITDVIGSEILSLAWATVQLRWIARPAVKFLFSFVTYCTCTLLAACYQSRNPATEERNNIYREAVRSILGGTKANLCGLVQFLNLSGVAIGCTIAFSTSMMGSLTGISIGDVTQTQKIWRSIQALSIIAFAYTYSIEVQDTSKSPPAGAKTMKNAPLVCVAVTTLFYILCGCMGYAAFGDMATGNLPASVGFFNPYWLIDIANVAIAIHLVGAYQVHSLPLFGFIEEYAERRFGRSQFITKEIEIPILSFRPYKLRVFKLIWRTIFVVLTTGISMMLPFFNYVVGLLGTLGFWTLTVYFPVEMYITNMKITKWSTKWLCLQILSIACLIITIAAAVGSVAGVVLDLKSYKPFRTSYQVEMSRISEKKLSEVISQARYHDETFRLVVPSVR